MNIADAQLRRKQLELSGTPWVDTGRVTGSPANYRVKVNCAGGDEIVHIPLGIAVNYGDPVLLIRNQMGVAWIIANLPPTTFDTVKGLPTPLPQLPNSGIEFIQAEASASWRGGVWRTDRYEVVQGVAPGWTESKGSFFYGSTPNDLLGGATITKAQVQLARQTGGFAGPQTLHMYFHNSLHQPAGAVVKSGTVVDVDFSIGQTQWVTIPNAWAQTIVNTGGGITVEGSLFVAMQGIDVRPDSGALRLDWSR